MQRILLVAALAALPFLLGVVVAAEKQASPAVGQKAPDFRLNKDDGTIFHLASKKESEGDEKKSSRFLLAFYPKDFTGG